MGEARDLVKPGDLIRIASGPLFGKVALVKKVSGDEHQRAYHVLLSSGKLVWVDQVSRGTGAVEKPKPGPVDGGLPDRLRFGAQAAIGAPGMGSAVKISSGPQAGRIGIVDEIREENSNTVYKVALEGGESTWASDVCPWSSSKAEDDNHLSHVGFDMARISMYSHISVLSRSGSLVDASTDLSPPPVRSPSPKKPRPLSPLKAQDSEGEIREGFEVEVVDGKHKGERGVVLKVVPGVAGTRYRVKLQGAKAATWVLSLRPTGGAAPAGAGMVAPVEHGGADDLGFDAGAGADAEEPHWGVAEGRHLAGDAPPHWGDVLRAPAVGSDCDLVAEATRGEDAEAHAGREHPAEGHIEALAPPTAPIVPGRVGSIAEAFGGSIRSAASGSGRGQTRPPCVEANAGDAPSGKDKGKGKGKGKIAPPPVPPKRAAMTKQRSQPTPQATPSPHDLGEGAAVTVSSGTFAGRDGVVLKVSGERDETRWRVRLDAGPTTWVGSVELRTGALQGSVGGAPPSTATMVAGKGKGKGKDKACGVGSGSC